MGVLVVRELTFDAGPVATATAPADGGSTDAWVLVVLALLGSSVVASLMTSVIAQLRAAADTRRDGYSRAVRSLIARGEYPYRVRRRISDAPEVLSALVERGHDLQEELAACRTWVVSEHRILGAMFEEALTAIDATVGQATRDAWCQPPITAAAGMNLNGWGPGDQWPHVARLERAIAFRFGLRRVIPPLVWKRFI